VELVKQPLRWLPADDWMQDSFTWFKTRKRFDAYQPVYGEPVSAKEGSLPASGFVRVKKLSREEMAFETDAVGYPHLIKIAYHPRWRLESRGSLHIAAPGFMLVVPEEKEIVLVYGHTPIGKLGMAASSAAFLLLGWIAYRGRRRARPAAPAEAPVGTWRASLIGWLVLVAAGGYFAVRAPERVYASAWDSMRANRYQEASADFAQAYTLRRPPAKREEALFWQAKATELAGKHRDALALYKELVAGYHGYWVPESLHQIVVLERGFGLAANADPYIVRLREDHPGNRWTQKLNESEPR
jgi:hypothetical protein